MKNRLIKKLSISIASLALIAPLALNNAQSAPIHADRFSRYERLTRQVKPHMKPKSYKQAYELGIGSLAEMGEYDVKDNINDPDGAVDAYYNGDFVEPYNKSINSYGPYRNQGKRDYTLIRNRTQAGLRNIIKKGIANGKFDRRETTKLEHKFHYYPRIHRHAKKHITRKHHIRKNKYGDDKLPNADQVYNYEMKHDKQYRDAENYETANYDHGVIEDMKSDPGLVSNVLYDAYDNHEHVNKTVLAKARYWEHKDKANGSWYSPSGEPNKYYAWGHHTKRTRRSRAKKHVARKRARKNKYGDDNMSQTAKDLLSVNKHDKQYQRAEHHETTNYNHGVIEDMKSDPSTVYSVIYDAFNEHEHVNRNVLRHAEYWEHRDKANGSWYSPNGEPDKRYAWGHHLKRGHHNHARKHLTRKHSKRTRKHSKTRK